MGLGAHRSLSLAGPPKADRRPASQARRAPQCRAAGGRCQPADLDQGADHQPAQATGAAPGAGASPLSRRSPPAPDEQGRPARRNVLLAVRQVRRQAEQSGMDDHLDRRHRLVVGMVPAQRIVPVAVPGVVADDGPLWRPITAAADADDLATLQRHDPINGSPGIGFLDERIGALDPLLPQHREHQP